MSTVQEPPQTTRDWFWAVPLVTSAYDTVTSVYEGTRDRNALTRFALGTVESSVKLASRCASPLVHQLENKLEKPLSVVDAFALKKLQKLEASYPIIKKPSDEVLTQGKEVLIETSQRVAKYPGVKLIGSSVSVGTTVIGSSIKLGQQGISSTINAGRRSINTANNLVGKGVDQCLNATEAVVKYLLPEEQEKGSMDESLLISSSTENAKKERRRRRQQRRKRREMCKAHHLSKTWAGRLERTQDIVCTAMDRSGDKVYDYLEWPIEHLELFKTLRIAKAAATAYEMIQEYLEEAGDQLKAINPLKMKEKKINLLTDSDDEDETSILDSMKTLATSTQTTATNIVSAMVNLPIHLAVFAYKLTFGISVFLTLQGRAISVKVYDESQGITYETIITKINGLKDAMFTIVRSYLGYAEEFVSTSKGTSPLHHPPSTKQSFTLLVTQQGDTPVEDVHHSDSDHSESNSDEGSSDHDDEPEQKSEDDD